MKGRQCSGLPRQAGPNRAGDLPSMIRVFHGALQRTAVKVQQGSGQSINVLLPDADRCPHYNTAARCKEGRHRQGLREPANKHPLTHARCVHLPWRRKRPLEPQVHGSSTRNGIHDVELVARAEDDGAVVRRPCAQFGNLRGGVAFCHSSNGFASWPAFKAQRRKCRLLFCDNPKTPFERTALLDSLSTRFTSREEECQGSRCRPQKRRRKTIGSSLSQVANLRSILPAIR
jgi:hypothetical protein